MPTRIKAAGAALMWAFLSAAACGRDALAISLAPTSLATRISEAALVAVVEITAATPEYVGGRECGTRYEARIVRGIKYAPQKPGVTTITFGKEPGLVIGDRYLLFFIDSPSAEKIYEDLSHLPPNVTVLDPLPPDLSRDDAVAFIRCNGLVPGYHFSPWEGLYELFGDETVIMWEPMPSPWPQSVRREQLAPGKWSVNFEDLFSYMQALVEPQAREHRRN